MNYIEYTEGVLLNFIEGTSYEQDLSIVIFGPGYNPNFAGSCLSEDETLHVHIPHENEDICDFCERYKNSENFALADLVIMSRVLEHIPVRQLDWYLYNIYTIMAPDSKLICVVPNMHACFRKLREEFREEKPNQFLINRLQYEILSEGPNVWDRHAAYTDRYSIKYYLEAEGLFKIQKIKGVRIDTDMIPQELEVVARRL